MATHQSLSEVEMVVTVRTRSAQSPTEGDSFTRYENDALSAQLPSINGADWAPFVGATPESTQGADWKVSIYVTADAQEEACMRGLAVLNELPCFNRDWERIYASAVMVGMSTRRWQVVVIRQPEEMVIEELPAYPSIDPFADALANVPYDIPIGEQINVIWAACLDMKLATKPLTPVQRSLALYAMDEAEESGTPLGIAVAALWSLLFSEALPRNQTTDALRLDLVRYRDTDSEADPNNFSGLYFEWQDMIAAQWTGIVPPGETVAEAASDTVDTTTDDGRVVVALNVVIGFEATKGWRIGDDGNLVRGEGYGMESVACTRDEMVALIHEALVGYPLGDSDPLWSVNDVVAVEATPIVVSFRKGA